MSVQKDNNRRNSVLLRKAETEEQVIALELAEINKAEQEVERYSSKLSDSILSLNRHSVSAYQRLPLREVAPVSEFVDAYRCFSECLSSTNRIAALRQQVAKQEMVLGEEKQRSLTKLAQTKKRVELFSKRIRRSRAFNIAAHELIQNSEIEERYGR